MNSLRRASPLAVAVVALTGMGVMQGARADTPCGDLSECRVLIEVNATDGDIGLHALFDADEWKQARILAPGHTPLFKTQVTDGLREQGLTENFFESAEPVCEAALAEDPDEMVVTLPEFLQRFPAGDYAFRLQTVEGGWLTGSTTLSHAIPAAPVDIDFDGRVVSWAYGDDLGECTTVPSDFEVADETDLVGYEVAVEPDDEALAKFRFTALVPNGSNSITVPLDYLASLPPGTPLKIEVGAIERRPNGSFGNQTFSEAVGFCNYIQQVLCDLDPGDRIAPWRTPPIR